MAISRANGDALMTAKTASSPIASSCAEEEDARLVHELAHAVAERGLVAPAIFVIEMFKPFGVLGSQLLLLIEPLLAPQARLKSRRYALLLEQEGGPDQLLDALQELRS